MAPATLGISLTIALLAILGIFINSSAATMTRHSRRYEFVGLAPSSSHAAGVVERFGGGGARDALRDLAAPTASTPTGQMAATRVSATSFNASPCAAIRDQASSGHN